MSIITLLILAFIIAIGVFLVRSVVLAYKRTANSSQPKFPVLSIVLLSISFVLFVVGTVLIVTISDVIGGILATLAGFLGSLESYLRHKREPLSEGASSR